MSRLGDANLGFSLIYRLEILHFPVAQQTAYYE